MTERLLDIVENIDAISTYLEGRTFESFAAERVIVDATERCLERIAEATVKIGGERMAMIAPALPVEKVRGLGNLLRHAYDIVDLQQLFNLARKDLPPLRAACVAALGEV